MWRGRGVLGLEMGGLRVMNTLVKVKSKKEDATEETKVKLVKVKAKKEDTTEETKVKLEWKEKEIGATIRNDYREEDCFDGRKRKRIESSNGWLSFPPSSSPSPSPSFHLHPSHFH